MDEEKYLSFYSRDCVDGENIDKKNKEKHLGVDQMKKVVWFGTYRYHVE